MENDYWTYNQIRINSFKNCDQKAVHKITEATAEFIGNKIINRIVKRKPLPDVNSRKVKEIFNLQEKQKKY